jgi:tripartite ATP-independent transporter DctM subunit
MVEGDPRVTTADADLSLELPAHLVRPMTFADRLMQRGIAALVVAEAVVVGLQVIGRHVFSHPLPWTEEIARLLLGWLMCAGGVWALRHNRHPRVTVLLRRFTASQRQAIDRGLRLVLAAFFLCLVVPSWNLTVASAAERLPASGVSGAAVSAVLPVALFLMLVELLREIWREGALPWRTRTSVTWSLGAALLALASVIIPLVVDAAPLLVLVSGFLVTAAMGVPLAFTLALTSMTYLLGIGGVGLIILPIKILGGVDSFVLLAIPLFILAGALMESGGISQRIVALAMAIVGRVRGGLAMVVVVAEVLFSGISGSTAADVSAISSLLVPSMKRAGYSGAESVSVVAAASAMGILVPPCLTMVVLGSLVNLSIVTLFLAGFVPAFILAAVLIALIAIRARRQGWPASRGSSRADLGRAARAAAVPLGLPVILFGGIFSGATTVTEAALIAVVYALVAGFFIGGIRRTELVGQFAESGIVTATTLWVLAAASAFAWILVREWVPQTLGEWIASAGAGRAAFLTLTIAIFVVIGALLEGLPALLIFGPILFPIARTLGVDPVHYGIVIIAAMGIAFFLPPIGVGLSIAAGIARVDIDDVSHTYVPYLVALLIGLALIAAFPVLTLVLPRMLLGYK